MKIDISNSSENFYNNLDVSGNISANNLFTNTINRNNIENLYNFISNYVISNDGAYNKIDNINSSNLNDFTTYYLNNSTNSTNSDSETGFITSNSHRNWKVTQNDMLRKFGPFAVNNFLNLFIQFKVINNNGIKFTLNNNNRNSSINLLYSSTSFTIIDSIETKTINNHPVNANDIIILWYSVNINKLLVIKLNTSSFSIIHESNSWNYLDSNNDIYFTFSGNIDTNINDLYFNVYSPYSSHPDLLKEKIFNDYDKFLNIKTNPLEIYDKSNYKNLAFDYDDYISQDIQVYNTYPINSNNYTSYYYKKNNVLDASGIINFYNNIINTKFTDNFYFQCQIDTSDLSSNFAISLFDENDTSYYLSINFNQNTGQCNYVPSTDSNLTGPSNSYSGISLTNVNITNNIVIILFYDGNIFSFYTIDSSGLNVIIKDHYYFKLANRKIYFRIASQSSFYINNIYLNDYCPYANNIDDFEKGNFSYYKNFLQVNAKLQLTEDILINGNIIINSNVNISNFNNDLGYIQESSNIELNGNLILINSGNIIARAYHVNSSDNDLSFIDKTYAGVIDYDFAKGMLIKGKFPHAYFRVGVCRLTSDDKSTSQIWSNSDLHIYSSTSIIYETHLYDQLFYTSPGRSMKFNGTPFQTMTSDDRIKFNETLVENGLDVINQVNIYKYDKVYEIGHTPENNPYKKEVGVIAQEIQQIPELAQSVVVNEVLPNQEKRFPNGVPMSVYYDQIHSYHIKATQELHQLVKTLQARIEVLEQR